MASRWIRAGVALMALLHCACGPEAMGGRAVAPAALDPASGQGAAPGPAPDIVLSDRDRALAEGQGIAFDGIAEGLAWPSLGKALAARPAAGSAVVTIQADRNVRVLDVLRAAWTVRDRPVLLQTFDAAAVLRAAPLGAKVVSAAGPASGCHVAVFVRPDGSLRVAAPGGPREITGEHAADALARALEAERATCPIRYVAFGAESDDAPWGTVFDVILAVDRGKSAGDARYVLGQAMRVRK